MTSSIDVRCPSCDYSPVEYVRAKRERAIVLFGECAYLMPDWSDMPETRADVLDFFEVSGAGEGCVFCPVCSCEFNTTTGEIANENDNDPHAGMLF